MFAWTGSKAPYILSIDIEPHSRHVQKLWLLYPHCPLTTVRTTAIKFLCPPSSLPVQDDENGSKPSHVLVTLHHPQYSVPVDSSARLHHFGL